MDAAAPEGSTGVARSRSARHHWAALLPEARRQAEHPGYEGAGSVAMAWTRGTAGSAERTGASQRGANERDRVPHLELTRQEHRQPRPRDLRPRSGRRREMETAAG